MKKDKGLLREQIRERIRLQASDVLESANFARSDSYIQHANISTREHSIHVAEKALRINDVLHAKSVERDLVRGALLHDFFLYDWHQSGGDNHHPHVHGFTHPTTALNNAEKEFELTPRERDVIKKHMWPLTVVPPLCREAWLVTLADKICTIQEKWESAHYTELKLKDTHDTDSESGTTAGQ